MELFFREGERLRRENQPFRPFLLVQDPSLLSGFKGEAETHPLSGEGELRHLVFAPDWKGLTAIVKILVKNSGKSAGDPSAPYYFPSDPVHQHLLLTGQTLFKEMLFDDLVRMQVDIETAVSEGFEFPNPRREGDRIIAIGIGDNRGFELVLSGKHLSEPEMIRALIEIVQERDPDV
ncbi:MAG TPA: DNA polymerase II, partial [Nitrospiria bacterium]|nr:DNA polymerase II [Nitrospiria bacterium]